MAGVAGPGLGGGPSGGGGGGGIGALVLEIDMRKSVKLNGTFRNAMSNMSYKALLRIP